MVDGPRSALWDGWRAAAGAVLALLMLFGLLTSLPAYPELSDFGAFYASGRAVTDGLNPYGDEEVARLRAAGFSTHAPDLDPPVWLPYFWLLSRAPPWWAFVGHVSGSVIAYLAVVAHYARARGPWFVATWLASTVLWETVATGQVYVEVLVALCVADAWLTRRPAVAGLLVGAACAAKPNLALVVPVLVVCGHWRTAGWALLGAAGAAVVAWPFGGAAAWLSWADVVQQLPISPLPINIGLWRLGTAPALVALAGLTGLLWRARHAVDVRRATQLGVALGLLFAPTAWPCYAMFLLPTFARERGPVFWLAALALCTPANLAFSGTTPELGLVFPAAVLLVAVGLLPSREPALRPA